MVVDVVVIFPGINRKYIFTIHYCPNLPNYMSENVSFNLPDNMCMKGFWKKKNNFRFWYFSLKPKYLTSNQTLKFCFRKRSRPKWITFLADMSFKGKTLIRWENVSFWRKEKCLEFDKEKKIVYTWGKKNFCSLCLLRQENQNI